MSIEGGSRLTGLSNNARPRLPLVSVITVVRNNKDTIERTIKSVLEQDYKNIEYIIVDGASTDGTLDLITSYADHLDYYISEPDSGIYNAMNKGLALCTGDLVGIINSDDWYETDAIGKVASAYLECETCVQHGLVRRHDDKGALRIVGYYSSRLPAHMIQHPTCFVPSILYKKYGHFNEEYRLAADYDLMLRFYKNDVNFNLIENVLANFTMGGAVHSNDEVALQEVINIRYAHGLLTNRQYHMRLLKMRVTSRIDRTKDIFRSILRMS